jgi:hypothetical protein
MNGIAEALTAVQSLGSGWNLRAIDILITILLTVLIGLSTWALKTVLAHAGKFATVDEKLGKIGQQLWGVDGRDGHTSELKELNESIDGLKHSITRLIRRVDRIDYHLKLPEFRERREDKEED